MKECNVHNVRFYEFQPEAIHCLAYNNDLKLLALSRADGSMELWDCQNKPFKQDTLIGQKGSSVESLVWCTNKLFSAGFNGFILEYNIPGFSQKNQVAVTGGPTWCLSLSPNKQFLAAGTEEGYICIFEVLEDCLQYYKTLSIEKKRILSIGWHSDSDHIVTGSVNFVHLISSKTEKRMQLHVGKKSPSQGTIVWCVAILDDMTIITGDSRGFTCFWDGIYGTTISMIQTHQADVLTMQVQPNLRSIYVAGVDPLIVEVRLVESDRGQRLSRMWVKNVQRKIHTHDVRSLAITREGKLFSGGVDTYLALSYYPPRTVIKFPATPPRGYTSIAKRSHSLLLGYKNRVELWKLGKYHSEVENADRFLSLEEDRVKLVEIKLKASDTLEFCAVSPRAKRIAYIVRGKLRICNFTSPQEVEGGHLEKIRSTDHEVDSSLKIQWIDDERLVSAAHSGNLQVLTVAEGKVSIQNNTSLPSGEGLREMTSSEDGTYLAVLECNNFVTVFETKENTLKKITTLKSTIPVTAFAINQNQIFLTFSNTSVAEYNIKTDERTSFSALMNAVLSKTKINNVFQNISFKDPDYVLLHSVSSFYVINKNAEPSGELATKVRRVGFNADRKASQGKTLPEGLLSTIRRSNHILYFSHLNDNDLISIETNPIWLLDSLPPVLNLKKYGAT